MCERNATSERTRAEPEQQQCSADSVLALIFDARGNGGGWNMPDNHRRSSEQNHGLHRHSCFQNTGFGWWRDGEIAETLRTPGGGDSMKANLVIDTLVFDESQITSRQNGNRPTWGGCCHTLHRNANRAVVIIRSEDESIQPNQPECRIQSG